MPDLDDTVEEVLADFTGTETYDEAEFLLRDFSAKEISVNAAKIAVAGGGAPGGAGGWPVNHFFVAMTTAKAQSNFDNFQGATSGSTIPFGVRTSDDTNGAWIEWYAALAEGEWALTAKGWPWTGGGILVFSLSDDDGATRADIDDAPYGASASSYQGYSDPETPDQVGQLVADDITISTAGEYVLRATVTGKHASSSGHATNLTWVQLSKVGA